MTREEWKNNKAFDRISHEMNSLYNEWPTPADTVASFGGDPDKVPDRQWRKARTKKNTPTAQ